MTYPTLKNDYLTGQPYAAADANQERTVVNQHSSALVALVRAGLELFNDFTNDANGAVPATTDTGQTWTVSYNRIGDPDHRRWQVRE